VSWQKLLEAISLNNQHVSFSLAHGKQCGFERLLTEYLPWSKINISPGDPLTRIIILLDKKLLPAGDKIPSSMSSPGAKNRQKAEIPRESSFSRKSAKKQG